MIRLPPKSTPFPYTTLFRSLAAGGCAVSPPASTDAASRQPLGEGPSNFADRKSTRLNSSHSQISYAVFCLKKKKYNNHMRRVGYYQYIVLTTYDASVSMSVT